jgi:hypothetical protein
MDIVVEVWDDDNKSGLDENTVYAELYDDSEELVRSVTPMEKTTEQTGLFFGGQFYSTVMNLDGLEAGEYQLRVYASDNVGNTNIVNRTINLTEGIYVEYIDPSSCSVSSTEGGDCLFTYHACVRGRDSLKMWMDKLNSGDVDPFTLNATLHKNGQQAEVGLMNETDLISTADLLNLTESECDDVAGMTTFDLTLDISPEVAQMIGGNYQIIYNITAFDEYSCVEEE